MPFVSGNKIKLLKKEVYQKLVDSGVDSILAYSEVYGVPMEEASKIIKKNRYNELRKMGYSVDLSYLIAYVNNKSFNELNKTR